MNHIRQIAVLLFLVSVSIASRAHADMCLAPGPFPVYLPCPYVTWSLLSSDFMDANKLPNYQWDPVDATATPGGWQDDRNHKIGNNYAVRPLAPGTAPALVVFLPGGGGHTENATEFYQYAATQGFFVAALDYINDAGPTEMCTCNTDCYADLYQQTVDMAGVDNGFFDLYFDSPSPQAGMRAYNSIENRLVLLLQHMQSADTSYGSMWGAYLDVSPGGTTRPAWNKIIIAGHSDGSRVAAWILANRPVRRALFFSGPKDQLSRPASYQIDNFPLMCLSGCEDYTSAPWSCTVSETVPSMFLGWSSQKIDKMRIFEEFYDERYEPGVTQPVNDLRRGDEILAARDEAVELQQPLLDREFIGRM